MPIGSVYRALAAIALVLSAQPSDLSAAPDSSAFYRRAGLYDAFAPDSVWFQIADSTLAVGDTLTLLTNPELPPTSPETPAPPRLTAAHVGRRLGRETARDLVEGPTEWAYLLRVAEFDSIESTIGIGIVAPRAAFVIREGHVESDVDADGMIERYSECASFEGVHFQIWEGRAPFQGEFVARFYYYVPYALDPTCPGIDPGPTE
ncbi:MAG: hypothetical protein AABZ94_05885 [Candidatus Eisenbacteria bacterium]